MLILRVGASFLVAAVHPPRTPVSACRLADALFMGASEQEKNLSSSAKEKRRILCPPPARIARAAAGTRDQPCRWPPRPRFLARSPCFAIALGEPLFSYLSCAPPPHIASTSLPQLPAVALRTSRVSFPAFMHWRSFVPLDCFAFASNQLLR